MDFIIINLKIKKRKGGDQSYNMYTTTTFVFLT